jgi:ATP-dependent protease ClpP protease subunit
MFNHFERMQQRIIDFVTSNSKISDARFKELLVNRGEMVTDMGTVLNGEQAVKEGLIDKVGTLSSVLSELYSMIEN